MAGVRIRRFPRVLNADLAVYHDGNNLTAVYSGTLSGDPVARGGRVKKKILQVE